MRMDVNVRQERSEDWEAIQDINTQAFGRPAEARLVDRIRQSQGFIPELSLTAWQAERLVGHALFSRITLQTAAGHQKILALGPIAVLPQHQRRGVGSQLIRAGIEIATEAGWSGIILIGHPTYYPRFGFTPASRFGLKTTLSVPDEVFMALPLGEGSLNGLSGTVIYPAAFDGV